MSIERRRAPRYRLITTAEVSAEGSNATVKAKTSDVSLVGCFMNTTQSFPQGTKVKLKLLWNDDSFSSTGVVSRLQPMGMGISFENVKKDQTETLRQWLSAVSRGPLN
jgi:PilZ domain-containing protein